MIKTDDENAVVATLSCILAIIGIISMRVILKLDYQVWSIVYLATAATAAIRWTNSGAGITISSAFRAAACLAIGLGGIKLAGYSSASSFQTASLVPHEFLEALGRFHIYFDN